MKHAIFVVTLCSLLSSAGLRAASPDSVATADLQRQVDSLRQEIKDSRSRSPLTIGGYGEAVYTRNFFSDKYLRYTDAETYRGGKSHGRFDLPHVVVWLGYDFGRGWTMGTEIEFEHGGMGSAVEIEEEEAGEYESEIERGGEVALEQFWINKEFWGGRLNVKVGHVIVPFGHANKHHTPVDFFTNYRPEGENTLFPCTWHENGLSIWGEAPDWEYEILFLPGLDSDRFGRKGWIHDGAGSPYEFKIANSYAGAFRVDNRSFRNLRLALSGYVGNSFRNTLGATDGERYRDVRGTVLLGAFDFSYETRRLIVRGNFDYGHLSDSELITRYNMSMRKDSPSPRQAVASDALTGGIEAGYDFFGRSREMDGRQLWAFARYEYYDSMFRTQGSVQDYKWCGRHRVAAGVNYRPVKDIVFKAEYSIGLLDRRYDNEPSVSFGVAYSGLFRH